MRSAAHPPAATSCASPQHPPSAGSRVARADVLDGARRCVARALAIEVGLILPPAVLAAAIDARPAALSGDAVIALLALAMGVRNATVRRLGVPDLTTAVLTMTIAGRDA
jgi:Protein of unknown function (DUF1275)